MLRWIITETMGMVLCGLLLPACVTADAAGSEEELVADDGEEGDDGTGGSKTVAFHDAGDSGDADDGGDGDGDARDAADGDDATDGSEGKDGSDGDDATESSDTDGNDGSTDLDQLDADGADDADPLDMPGALTTTPTDTPGAPSSPPPAAAWVPSNDGATPARITQADLLLACQKMGPGLSPGYVRYGCKAMRRDTGAHYGIVKGWWQVVRADGRRARARDLNFREGGYDMTFDVAEADAATGIDVRPGPGACDPRTCR